MMKAQDVLEMAKQAGVVMVDLRFIDLPGVWQHTSVPIHRLDEGAFEDGFGFDGSSIRGYQPINASDMLVVPDASTAQVDPFTARPTLVLIGSVVDPITRQPYSRDPRYVARKAEAFLQQSGVADTCSVGPEAEFFVFDDIRFDQNNHEGYYFIDSVEGEWNTGREEKPNLGHKIRHKEGYFPVPPVDTLMDLRTEMVEKMHGLGIEIEVSHHEVASAGQCEIDMKYAPLVQMADKLMWFKYVVRNVAHAHSKTATFMPKPLYGDNGSGMHVHQSLWKGGKPLFSGDGYAQLSEMGLHFIGGVLKHAPALSAITNPTTNSYRRLVPGFEAPVNLAYSSRNRSASIRIPMYDASPKSKRIEVRFPDPSCNPYLAFSALMMAGVDGILNKIDPGDPLDKDIYALSSEELSAVPHLPGSLEEALRALEQDHQFLLKGDVFTRDVIEMWIDYKRERELLPVQLRPVPYEFLLYYNI
jgi:glutamine synthetase